MSDFSIETSAERIVDARTRRYFSEVYGSYSAGYYRSAVVMLWSVIVTDLLFKLDQLANAYNDNTAKLILDEIETSRRNNPKSPEWETELLDKVAARTDLLDSAERSFLETIQRHRHLSAHPILNQHDALFSPNKETTRAHIRNALESLLIKPPIMSKKVFDAFVEDIEEVSRLNPGHETLKRFLQTKYFGHFSLTTAIAVFRSLWRLVFKSGDSRCESNRSINGSALSILIGHWKSELLQAISEDRAWFSDVSFGESQIKEMVKIFSEYPRGFELLTDAAKAPIQDYAKQSLDRFASCLFLSSNPEDHVGRVKHRIEAEDEVLGADAFERLCNSVKGSEAYLDALLIGIILYARSVNFDTADERFQSMVQPYIGDYNREHFESFLDRTEANDQTWGRGRAARDHRKIERSISSQFPDLNLKAYPHFLRSLEE